MSESEVVSRVTELYLQCAARPWSRVPRIARSLFAAFAALLFAAVVHAQALTGSVLARDGSPVSGALVVATTSRNDAGVRTLSGSRGEFRLRLPQPGRYTVTVLRVGYRPTQGPTVDVAAGVTERVQITFSGEVVTLTAVNVRERETCRVSADTGYMVARVWDEARKAMLSSQLTADEAPLFAEWVEYDRQLDSTGRLVRAQRVKSERHPTTHAFRSKPVAVLDSLGYVVSDASGTTYYAPDAEVLLSESFASRHCFHLVGPQTRADSGLVGVAFAPGRDASDSHEIAGTLWLDRATAELRRLEFKYTNLPDVVASAGAGGRVEFLRLIDGNWLINRWSLRMPQVERRGQSAADAFRRTIQAASTLVVHGVQVTGGEVDRVMRNDSIVYRATGPAIDVQVAARDSSVTPAGTRLFLEGTDYSDTADASGHVHLSPVLAGRYKAHLSSPLMDSLGLRSVTAELEASEKPHVDTLMLPTPHDVASHACPRDSLRDGEAMLRGTVRTERAQPVPGAAVTLTWQTGFAVAGMRDGGQLAYNEQTIGALTNEAGVWRLCGVPQGKMLVIATVSDSGSDTRRIRLVDGDAMGAVDLVAHRQGIAQQELDIARGKAGARALVEFSASELGGLPLPETQLDVTVNGTTRHLVTGPTGRALLPDMPVGKFTVRARHIGFQPGQLEADVEPGRNTVPILLSRNAIPALDTVRVLGNQRLIGIRRNDEVEARRRLGLATVSITRDDIVKRNPIDTWQMLTGIPSIRVIDSANVTVESSRSKDVTPGGIVKPCYILVMVDGIVKTGMPGNAYDLRDLPKPEEVHAIEVFAGPSSIPVQYGGTGTDKWCGMIAVWTR